MTDEYEFQGFNELEKMLSDIANETTEENVTKVLKRGADELVSTLMKLPKPMSKIRKAGYTHLVRTFYSKVNKNQVEVGWGKYYGPMVERGTKRMKARPHIMPTWKQNKEKIYKVMVNDLGLQRG